MSISPLGYLNGVTVPHRGFTPMSGHPPTCFDCCSGTAGQADLKHLKHDMAGADMSPIRPRSSPVAIAKRELETGR